MGVATDHRAARSHWKDFVEIEFCGKDIFNIKSKIKIIKFLSLLCVGYNKTVNVSIASFFVVL